MSLSSILLVNDYVTLCKLKDSKCQKSFLARKYLNYKISKRLQQKRSNQGGLIYLLLGFLFIR